MTILKELVVEKNQRYVMARNIFALQLFIFSVWDVVGLEHHGLQKNLISLVKPYISQRNAFATEMEVDHIIYSIPFSLMKDHYSQPTYYWTAPCLFQ